MNTLLIELDSNIGILFCIDIEQPRVTDQVITEKIGSYRKVTDDQAGHECPICLDQFDQMNTLESYHAIIYSIKNASINGSKKIILLALCADWMYLIQMMAKPFNLSPESFLHKDFLSLRAYP